MKRQTTYLLRLLLLLAAPISVYAQQLSGEARVSLLTCAPGKPLYFHFGHSALRIQDPAYITPGTDTIPIDWVFNYGIFDFNTEHFYLKFLRGETDYMLGMEYTSDFLYSAAWDDRTVSYQPLILNEEQRQQVFDALLVNYKPENRYYRYNFVYDNCATRPWDIVRDVLELPEDNTPSGVTWRQNIDYYSGHDSWGRYGINLIFGYGADNEMTKEQALFLPENLMRHVSETGLSENEDIKAFVPRNERFITSPELAETIMLVLIAILTLSDVRRKRFTWQADITLFVLYALLGTIIMVLYFFSTLPFVDSNLNILMLNPLWLAAVVGICFSRTRLLLLKSSLYLLIAAAVCVVVLVIYGQTLHPLLALPVAQLLRYYILNKHTNAQTIS